MASRALLFAFFTVSLTGCAAGTTSQRAGDPPRETAALACDDVGSPGAENPILDSGGPVSVAPLTASALPDYDPDEDDLRREACVGAQIAFPVPRGWTKEWLQRRVGCYRSSQDTREASSDPLLTPDARVHVWSDRGRFFVDVFSREKRTAKKIHEAALALADAAAKSRP